MYWGVRYLGTEPRALHRLSKCSCERLRELSSDLFWQKGFWGKKRPQAAYDRPADRWREPLTECWYLEIHEAWLPELANLHMAKRPLEAQDWRVLFTYWEDGWVVGARGLLVQCFKIKNVNSDTMCVTWLITNAV